jgi:hypothetical protein
MKRAAKRGARSVQRDARGEQIFFDDPAVDGLMGMLMTLATDHYVLKDRVQALEQQLTRSGHVDPAALAAPPSAEDSAAANDNANAFAAELLRPLLGLQETAGTSGRFSLKKQRRRVRI